MNDYAPSDAAKAYSKGLCTISHPNHRANCLYETSFDAGVAHERESRKPRTITTASELRALPVKSVVITQADGGSWQKSFVQDDRWWSAEGMAGAPVTVMSSKELADRHGPFTLLVPASESAPEPVRLTDADDERIRPGARVRMVVEYVVDEEGSGVYHYPVQLLCKAVATPSDHETFYLLAEAPDPHAEIVAAITAALPNSTMPAWERDLLGNKSDADLTLDALRAAGYDVVKRVDQ